MKQKLVILVAAGVVLGGSIFLLLRRSPQAIVLTGLVTTDTVAVSSEIQGRLSRLLVEQGATVRSNQVLALIQPQEWKADVAFFANSEQQSAAQVTQARADLQYQEAQTSNQIRQAEATLAAAQAQVSQAEAEQENAGLNLHRLEDLYKKQVESVQTYDQARTSFDAAKARVEAIRKQAAAAEAAVALARANADQIVSRRAALEATVHQLAAANAQKEKAQVRLGYTEIRAPVAGVVDVRAALQGEVVSPGQAIVTLIDPDNLWVRADVEETYIDRIRLGDKLAVRLPSGARRDGVVFYRGVDAEYATQRDVSRTKRDIRTFEIRLRCDNSDRALALGMTAYVTFPLATK